MGTYTRAVTKEYEFDGDKITVTFNRLSRMDALVLSPFMKSKDDGSVTMTLQTQFEFSDVAAKVLKNSITSFTGLFIDGREITKMSDDFNLVFDEVFFMPLMMQIMGDVMSLSFVSSDVEKK